MYSLGAFPSSIKGHGQDILVLSRHKWSDSRYPRYNFFTSFPTFLPQNSLSGFSGNLAYLKNSGWSEILLVQEESDGKTLFRYAITTCFRTLLFRYIGHRGLVFSCVLVGWLVFVVLFFNIAAGG